MIISQCTQILNYYAETNIMVYVSYTSIKKEMQQKIKWRQPTEWKNLFANYMPNKECTSRLIKMLKTQ